MESISGDILASPYEISLDNNNNLFKDGFDYRATEDLALPDSGYALRATANKSYVPNNVISETRFYINFKNSTFDLRDRNLTFLLKAEGQLETDIYVTLLDNSWNKITNEMRLFFFKGWYEKASYDSKFGESYRNVNCPAALIESSLAESKTKSDLANVSIIGIGNRYWNLDPNIDQYLSIDRILLGNISGFNSTFGLDGNSYDNARTYIPLNKGNPVPSGHDVLFKMKTYGTPSENNSHKVYLNIQNPTSTNDGTNNYTDHKNFHTFNELILDNGVHNLATIFDSNAKMWLKMGDDGYWNVRINSKYLVRNLSSSDPTSELIYATALVFSLNTHCLGFVKDITFIESGLNVCEHLLSYYPEIPATYEDDGVKAHYQCDKCHSYFLDENATILVEYESLIIPSLGKDGEFTLDYIFKGNESMRRGYAEGTITFSTSTKFKNNDQFSFYFGKNNEVLNGFYPFYTHQINETNVTSFNFDINENVYLPSGANQILVFKNGVYKSSFDIDDNKLLNESNSKHKFASVSDIHINYPQGEKHLLHALNSFEEEGVEYVISSGDIGTNNTHYEKYINSCLASDFTGLIFAAPGNHDEENETVKNLFRSYGVYDGSSKTFVPLNQLVNYFTNIYDGDLNVNAFYEPIDPSGDTTYYYITIDDNLYFFMDPMCDENSSLSKQDNFSDTQLDLLEDVLYKYSGSKELLEPLPYSFYNLFIVEHAPFKQHKVGDTFTPHYGGQMELSNDFKRNMRFSEILKDYNEAILLTGHTHVQYDTSINFIDYEYDPLGNLTNNPLARTFHVSSLAQPRWYIKNGAKYEMQMLTDFSAGSECYIVHQTDDDLCFVGTSLKEKSENTLYDPSSYSKHFYSAYSYIIPIFSNSHLAPLKRHNVANTIDASICSGSASISSSNDNLLINLSALSDKIMFDFGTVFAETEQETWIHLYVNSICSTFDISSCDSNGNIQNTIHIDLSLKNDTNYLVSEKNGQIVIQIRFSALFDESLLNGFHLMMTSFDSLEEISISSFYINKFEDIRTRGKNFYSGSDLSMSVSSGENQHMSFEYRIDSGTSFKVALLDSTWSNYYGYFEFNSNGEAIDYSGIKTIKLDDDYIRVELIFSEITRTGDANNILKKPANVSIFYIRGSSSKASGYIDNLRFY